MTSNDLNSFQSNDLRSKWSFRIWCSKERSPTLSKRIIWLINRWFLPRPDLYPDQSSYPCPNLFSSFQACPNLSGPVLVPKAINGLIRMTSELWQWVQVHLQLIQVHSRSSLDNSHRSLVNPIFKTSWIKFNSCVLISTFHTLTSPNNFGPKNRIFWQK